MGTSLSDEFLDKFAEMKDAGAVSDDSVDVVEGADQVVEEPDDSAGAQADGDGGGDGGEATGGDLEVVATPVPDATPADGPPEDPAAAAEYWRERAEREEKRRRDTQSQKDREVAEANAKVEALQSLWESPDVGDEYAPAMQLPGEEQLDAWVEVAPQDAFRTVLEQAPHQIQDVIASIYRVKGPEWGAMAQQAYQAAVFEAQQAQTRHELDQVRESIEAPAKRRAEFAEALGSVRDRYGQEAIASVAPRVRELITSSYATERANYASTAAFVEAQYLRAYHEQTLSAAQQAATQQVAAVSAPAPHVEVGGGAVVVEPEKSYEQTKAERLAAAFSGGRTYG